MPAQSSAVDVRSIISSIAEFLRIQDWRFSVYVLPLDVLQAAFDENKQATGDEIVYGFTIYDQYERNASIYLASPEDLKDHKANIEEIALHEMLHVLVDGNRAPTDEIASERAVRTLTEILLPRVKRLLRAKKKKPK